MLITTATNIFAYVLWVMTFVAVTREVDRASKHFAYGQIRAIVTDQSNVRYRVFHRLNCALALCYAIRFTLVTIAMNHCLDHPLAQSLSRFDYFYHFARHFEGDRQRDRYFLVIFISLALSCTVLEHKLYFSRPDTLTWRVHYDVVVRNIDYLKLTRKMVDEPTDPIRTLHPIKGRAMVFVRKQFHMITADLKALYTKVATSSGMFTVFPGMSPQQWLSLVPTLKVVDLLSRLTLLGLYSTLWCFLLFYLHMFHRSMPSSVWPWVLLDLTLFCHVIARVLTFALLLFSCSLNGDRAYGTYINHWTRILTQAVRRIRTISNSLPITTTNAVAQFDHLLSGYLRAHSHTSVIFLYSNGELWSGVILWAMMLHVSTNIYVVYRLCAGGARFGLFWLILFGQAGILLGALMPMVATCKRMHRPSKVMCSVQLALDRMARSKPTYGGRVWLRHKLKYLALYERLTAKRLRYGVTIGPSKAITSRTIFQLFLIYVAYVLGTIQFFVGQSGKGEEAIATINVM